MDDMVAERGDVAYLHDLHETGDHLPHVEWCRTHGPYMPHSIINQECPTCLAEPWNPTSHPLPPLRSTQ
jgi:hypothetical protein